MSIFYKKTIYNSIPLKWGYDYKMEKIKYEVLDKIPEKNSNKKYYYFYKIVNLKNEKYYYGVHSAKYLDDNYRGSSKQLIKDIKEHGVSFFKKYILKFFETSEDMYEYEKKIVTKDVVLNKNCYNMHTGGNGSWDFTIGRVCVKDCSGNTMMVDVDNEDYLSGNLVSNMKGLLHVKTKDGCSKTITTEEYYKNKDLYNVSFTNYVVTKDNNNNIQWLKKEEFDKLKKDGKFFGITKNNGVFKDKQGNVLMCDITDERIKNGELVGITKGLGVYKYKNDFSKIVVTIKNDERVKNGELVGINYGLVHCINPLTKEKITVFKNDERLKNGEIMTCTKYSLIGKKIQTRKPLTLEDYKEKYPLVINYIEEGKTNKEIIEITGIKKKKIEYIRQRYKKVKELN
jgi:hypothetical protein